MRNCSSPPGGRRVRANRWRTGRVCPLLRCGNAGIHDVVIVFVEEPAAIRHRGAVLQLKLSFAVLENAAKRQESVCVRLRNHSDSSSFTGLIREVERARYGSRSLAGGLHKVVIGEFEVFPMLGESQRFEYALVRRIG